LLVEGARVDQRVFDQVVRHRVHEGGRDVIIADQVGEGAKLPAAEGAVRDVGLVAKRKGSGMGNERRVD
jgi:hypothetical protein